MKRGLATFPVVGRAVLTVERATAGRWGIDRTAGPLAADHFASLCPACGRRAVFVRNHRALREGYRCSICSAPLRYQGQADALVRLYAKEGARSLAALVREREFSRMQVWEPGSTGPLRRHLATLPGYVRSTYLPGVTGGEHIDGVRCEDLMAITFPDDSFDLVLTSDIFEHVRRPYEAFREVHRVLRPGGRHVFSIPVSHPMPSQTIERVDTAGPTDVHLVEPRYHHGPDGGRHLVYNDFGRDLLDELSRIGFETQILRLQRSSQEASRLLTFASRKPDLASPQRA